AATPCGSPGAGGGGCAFLEYTAVSARAMCRSLVGHRSGQWMAPSPRAEARASQSASPRARSSVKPHELLPLALKSPPRNSACQRASGKSSLIRSAASHEYGDMAPKKNITLAGADGGVTGTASMYPRVAGTHPARAARARRQRDRVLSMSKRVL